MSEIAEVNRSILQPLIDDVARSFPGVAPTGYMLRTINEVGSFEEQGIPFVAEDIPFGQLYAGLAVLCRDIALYLEQHPREDSSLFNEVITLVNKAESSTYGQQAFPNYTGLETSRLPGGLAAAAASGQPTISGLDTRDIVHEWTFKPGKRLLLAFYAKFGPKFKETICGKDGPYELVVKKRGKQSLLGQEELPYLIVGTILNAGFSPATFWYPLAVYLAILLIKAGLKTYCEPEQTDKAVLAQALKNPLIKPIKSTP